MRLTDEMTANPEFIHALRASGRAADIPEADDLYGWLVGSWELIVRHYEPLPECVGRRGEIHFEWVLGGRAIQDLWIMPTRADRQKEENSTAALQGMYGTTLRVWDAPLRAWRITWINPATGARSDLVGRRHGVDIVQIGTSPNGMPVRWTFANISPNSFLWRGEILEPDGRSWRLQGEFTATRRLLTAPD